MANTDVDPNLDPYSQEPVSPRAQSALSGGDEDAEDRAYRRQRRREFDELLREQRETSAREQEQLKQRAAEMAPREKAVEEQTQSFLQTSERERNRLTTRQEDVPAFDPNAAKGDAMAWMSLAAGFGAIAGGLSRYHTTAALNAFSGMMNGFAKGQLQVYEQKRDEWNAAADRVHELNARAQRDYKAIMDDAKLNLDAKSNLMEMTANKWQDNLMATQAQQRSIERMTQLMNARENFDQNMQFRREQSTKHDEQFFQRLDASLAEKGFRRNPDTGKVESDPDHPGAIDDASLDVMVERRLIGDKSVTQNIGRGAQGSANIARFNNRLAAAMTRRGITAADLGQIDQQFAGQGAYQVAAGRYASRVESATNELQQAIPLAEQASAAFDRGDWVQWNKLLNEYNAGTSNPKYNDFIVKAIAAKNAYVRAMNPTGNPRIAERLELQADNILSAAVSPQAFSTQLRGMWQEAENSRRGIAQTRGLPLPEPREYPAGPQVAPDTSDVYIEK